MAAHGKPGDVMRIYEIDPAVRELGLVLRNSEPAFDQRGVDFQMKLKSVGMLAVAKRLYRAIFRLRKLFNMVR